MARLDLMPFYLPHGGTIPAQLGREIERSLGLRVRIRRPSFDPELAYDSSRGQYSSTELLRLVLDDFSGQPGYVLGVTGVDLFVPVLTFVFGEAQLGGRAAIVSLHRLRPEAYGLAPDDDLLHARLLKESLHELGHVLGLIHCPEATCVMRSSTYVEQIDFKSADFCASCRTKSRTPGCCSPTSQCHAAPESGGPSPLRLTGRGWSGAPA